MLTWTESNLQRTTKSTQFSGPCRKNRYFCLFRYITLSEIPFFGRRTSEASLRKHPFLLALRRLGRFAWRNVCDSATEIPY